jgi:TM2 domain-containing membrane protein YozV
VDQTPKVCPICLENAPADAAVCAKCGHSFAPATPAVVPPTQPPTYGQPQNNAMVQNAGSNKIAAGICGILLGALGIHKFILGMTTPGIIMLLVSLLTCGFGAIPMSVIGLVEGIIYLTKSDAEFYQTYVVEKKPWF